jgi:hypothetical protein
MLTFDHGSVPLTDTITTLLCCTCRYEAALEDRAEGRRAEEEEAKAQGVVGMEGREVAQAFVEQAAGRWEGAAEREGSSWVVLLSALSASRERCLQWMTS